MGKRKTLFLLVAVGLLAAALSGLGTVTAQTRGATYIVRMREQADLAAVRGNRVAVETLLRATAERTQAPLLARLEGWRREGKVQSYQSLWIVNAITVGAPKGEAIDALRADAAVASVTVAAPVAAPPARVTRLAPSRIGAPVYSWGLQQIGADQLWNRGTNPTTGAGVRVAVLDTGIDATHPDFAGKIVAWKDFVGTSGVEYDDETYGHGTHVAGTVAGANLGSQYRGGVAPGASLIVGKVLRGNDMGGETDDVLAAAQWALNPDNNVNTADGADVVSCSLGTVPHGDDESDELLKQTVQTLHDANVFPVFAIGNSGPSAKTTSSPGDYPNAFGVGATDDTDTVASFSSRGPVVWGGTSYIKPDATAPGVAIISCVPTRVAAIRYGILSGTSQAAPHVAGTIALAISATRLHKGFTPTVDSLVSALKSTAVELGSAGADNAYGSGRINAVAFVDALLGAAPTIGKPTLVEPAASAIFREPVSQVKVQTTVSGSGALLKYKVTIKKSGAADTVYDQTTQAGAAAFDKKAQPYLSGQTATVSITALSAGSYTWTASVTSDGGATWTSSDEGSFAVNQVPAAAASAPEAGALVETHTPTFQVAVSDPDGGTLKAKVIVKQGDTVVQTFDETSAGWDKASYASGETATLVVPGGQALANGAYTWSAAAWDGVEWSPETAARALTIGVNTPPSAPELVAPAAGAYVPAAPAFQVRAADVDTTNTLRFKVIVFQGGTPVQTFDQTVSATGWDKAGYAVNETATFTVPSGSALTEGQTYQWKAWAYDGKAWSAESAEGSLTVDHAPTAPQLVAPSQDTVMTGAVTFKVSSTDADSQVRFKLVLTSGSTTITLDENDARWDKAKYNSGETATLTISSASPLAAGSYTWRAYAFDDVVWSAASASGAFEVNTRVPANIQPALGTFGLGLNLGLSVVRADLGLDTVPMKVYDPTVPGYVDAPAVLVPGRGYWLKPGVVVPLSLAAPAWSGATFSIPLAKGWNFISSPFKEPLTWNINAIQVEAGGVTKTLAQSSDVIEDYAWGFVPSTTDSNSGTPQLVYDASVIPGITGQLAPWRGYWVKVKADAGCNLILPNPAGVSGTSIARASASGWSVPMQVRGAAGAQTIVLGVTSGRALAVGQPPLPPGAVGGFSAALLQNGAPLAVDVRSGARSRVEWEMVVDAAASDTDVVVAPDLRALPRDLTLTLIDTATGAQRSLRTSAAYRFRPTGEPRRFRLVAQPRSSALATITDIRMVKNRSGRTVQYTLSRAAVADIELVSPTGRVVATLARSRAAEAGVNFATAGDAIARGIYLVRVRATTEDGATVQAVRLVTVTD